MKFPSTMLAAALLASCVVDSNVGSDIPGIFRTVVNAPAKPTSKVDLLFVIDDSSNMAARQAKLADSFAQIYPQLEFGRGTIDLQLAFTTTSLGLGEFAEAGQGCQVAGDGGDLLSPRAMGCIRNSPDEVLANEERFLRYQLHKDGGSSQNYSGTLPEAFACMANLGESGCDYEQPLESMRRALTNSIESESGFVREGSVLGVVLLTDEDDCSAFNPSLFAASAFGGQDANFRCFQTGVICEGDDVSRPGELDSCRPRPNSEYITPITDYVGYLSRLRPDPTMRLASAIVGDPDQVVVEVDDAGNNSQLGAACKDATGEAAYPAIRLSAFADAFGDTGARSSLCAEQARGGLQDTITTLRQSIGTTCLYGAIADIDPVEAGRQVDCLVHETIPEEESKVLRFPECDNPANLEASSHLPCYSIQRGGEACGDFETQLSLQIHGRPAPPPPGSRLIARCLVEEGSLQEAPLQQRSPAPPPTGY